MSGRKDADINERGAVVAVVAFVLGVVTKVICSRDSQSENYVESEPKKKKGFFKKWNDEY